MATNSDSTFGDGVTLPPSVSNKQEITPVNNLPLVPMGEASITDFLSAEVRESLPVETRNQLDAYSNSTKFGFAEQLGPMICKDEQCPFAEKCPLRTAGVVRPIGKDCPLEQAQIANWKYSLTNAATIDPNDPASAYDMIIVDQVVYQMLLEARAAMQLAMSPEIEREYVSGYNPMGMPFITRETSKAAEFYDKLVKTKLRLMRELLATRRSKAEAESKGYADPSKVAADLMQRAARLRTAVKYPDGTTEAMEIDMNDERVVKIDDVVEE